MVPGSSLVPRDEQLVALWRNRAGERFQNYRATFTVLDANPVPRQWLDSVLTGDSMRGAPAAWASWVSAGVISALLAPPTTLHRTGAQQLPTRPDDQALLDALWTHFRDRPIEFERCAVELFRFDAPRIENVNVTRPSRDGGRDAVGQYAIGPAADPIRLNFALEAKWGCPASTDRFDGLVRLPSGRDSLRLPLRIR
jgi:Restriction endonuclease AspBHI N-terminal